MTPQELKNSILQLAIQGKLVEQRPEEVSVDLSKLKAKATDEYEFDLPEKWVISHLESISVPIPTKQYQVLESEVKKEGAFAVISQSKEYSIGFTDEKSKVFCHDIPVIAFGDHTTEVKYVTFDFVVGADGVKVFLPQIDYVFPKFLYYVFQFNCIGLNKVGGYSRHYKYIKGKPVPLPPLAEQKRIVAKIEELLPLIERYEQAWSRLEDFNKRFPGDMQKSILQTAIQGKLVEQRPEEGTADELYKQIRAEKQALIKAGKIKKEKPLPEITEDEIPFEIPDSWKWVRYSDLFDIGSAIRIHQTDWKTEGIPFFRGRELVRLAKTGNPDAEIFISRELYELNKEKGGVPQKGDLLVTAVGTLGKVYIVKGTQPFYYKDAYILRYNNFFKLFSDYFKYVIEAPFIQEYIAQGSMGTTVAQLTIEKAKRMLCPLPPLAEQKRIVARLEELLPLCERLK